MKTTVKVEGLRELDAALSAIAKQTTRKSVARRALKQAGEPILARARSLAPDDPRTRAPLDLTDSMALSSRQKSGRATKYRKESPSEVVIHIGPTKEGYPQAIMQEFGTVHHAAQPYLRPAWDGEGGNRALGRIVKAMKAAIDKAARRQAKAARR
jgi:HK97 gp10 family phage protein